MANAMAARRQAFAISYRDLQIWSVAAQFSVSWSWPGSVILPLASILGRRAEAALETLEPESSATLLTIRFDGSIEARESVRIKDVKGKLFRVYPGDVIFSKIDVRNGAIGLAPNDIPVMCATSEFPIYSVETKKAHPKYVKLLFRTAAFMGLLNSMISGATGRKRIQPSQLENVQVPVPPLPVQQEIVANWETAQTAVQKNRTAIAAAKRDSLDRFRRELGIGIAPNTPRPKLFAAKWSDLERWGYELVWRTKNGARSFNYPIKPLKETCKTGSGGTPSRKRKEYYGGEMPWVKTAEVKNAVITDTEEKITKEGLIASSAKLYPAGSLVVAMYGQGATRGRTAKLGVAAATNQACLVLTEIDPSVDPDFLWYYLIVSYEEMRGLASGNNQPNLSADLLGAFPIPIPPMAKQQELIALFEAAQQEIARLDSENLQTRARSAKEIEEMIVGTLPIEVR